ncbi:hypothetical protein FOA52_006322 [Chlamydomonas sp. UWO 241]|nr:hypothetical protein FOA52_006322 [Chlamydomonas sp. UWO 241]
MWGVAAAMGGGASKLPEADEEMVPHAVSEKTMKRGKVRGIHASSESATIFERTDDHISYCAVSLEWLMSDFLLENADIISHNLTTRDVVQEVVKPMCKTTESYVQMMHRLAPETDAVSRGASFYYVSHTWTRPFSELLVMLKEHFSPEIQAKWRKPGEPILEWSEVYVWLDMFAMNQHTPKDIDFKERWRLLLGLRDMVQDARQTLMVLDGDGEVLDRLWCLYDAWQSGRKGHGSLVLLSYGVGPEQLQRAETLFSWALQSKARLNTRGELIGLTTADPNELRSSFAPCTPVNEEALNAMLAKQGKLGGEGASFKMGDLMNAHLNKNLGGQEDPSTLSDLIENLSRMIEAHGHQLEATGGAPASRSRNVRRLASRQSRARTHGHAALPESSAVIMDMSSLPHSIAEEHDAHEDMLGNRVPH